MKLVIVESPTKAKTISRFLGNGYKIESSFGHVRDLPKSDMGIDIEHDFAPKYVIPTKAKKTVSHLKEVAKGVDEIILASDEDREGEAIAWHLAEILKIKQKDSKRIVFHEITEHALLEALKKPRHLDQNLVDAQQARRVLDRLVGYELSPFLWKKVAKGLSAGRVQSVAVRLVVEREREIQAFKSEEYWGIKADLTSAKHEPLVAELTKINGKTVGKLQINNETAAQKIVTDLADGKFVVADVEEKVLHKAAPAPFTTSTLQQAANRRLGYSAKQTMMLAQQLYEGIDIKGEGHVGLITYMRTDSLNLSDKFLGEAKEYLHQTFGEKYVLAIAKKFKTKAKGAQEAHEAIRPTDVARNPEGLRQFLSPTQFRLYRLIWQRALASQMPDAQFNQLGVTIDAAGQTKKYIFKAGGQVLLFDGYLKLYPETNEDRLLPQLTAQEKLNLVKITPEQHFTKPPARFSDASLVKEMEKYGIGRPSTYAPTIATIEARNYVVRDEAKKLKPTDIAFVVIDLLTKHFPDIVDYDFTADMEKLLDKIAVGKAEYSAVLRDFYGPFHKNLEEKYADVKKDDIIPKEETDEVCDKCGSPMIIKTGRFGKFLACSAFPACKNIKPLPGHEKPGTPAADPEKMKALTEAHAGEVCAKCGSPMAVKIGRFGPFLACTAYPKCKNIKNIIDPNEPVIACPVCHVGHIVRKSSRRGTFYACDRYPDCKTSFWAKPTGAVCPECSSLLVTDKDGNVVCSNKSCNYQQ